MKVLVLSTSYPSAAGDAAGHFVEAEARALAAQGHTVTVIAPGPPGSLTRGGVTMHLIHGGGAFGFPGALSRLRQRPTRILAVARFLADARRAITRLGPFDRSIAHFLVPSVLPLLGAQSGSVEVVGHGSDVRLLHRAPRLLARGFIGLLLSRDVSFRFVSEELRRLATEVHPGLADSKVSPARIDVSGVPPRADARRKLSIGPSETLLLVVGRLIVDKRCEVALGAALLVPNATVVCLGDGPERATLENRFPEARFLGMVSRPDALIWMSASDALITASRHEGAPSVVREARSLGASVVASPAGDLAAWAEHDDDLWVVGGPTGDTPETR